MPEPTTTPDATTQQVSAVEAAVIAGGSGLSDGVEAYRSARAAERQGKPQAAVEIPVQKTDDGDVTPVDPKAAKREARAAKQNEINEGARKAASRVVEDYEKQIKDLQAQLAERMGQPPPPSPVVAPQAPLRAATADPEPDPADVSKYPGGEYDPKYLRDVGRWDARQIVREQEEAAQRRSAAQNAVTEHQQTRQAFVERMDAAGKADTTFLSKLDQQLLVTLRPTAELGPQEAPAPINHLADLVLRSAVAPQMLQHFTVHPEAVQEILRTGPATFYRLEGSFLAHQTPSPAPESAPPETITRAPSPPDLLGSRTTTPGDPIATAITTGKGTLTGGVRDFRAARFSERMAAQGRR